MNKQTENTLSDVEDSELLLYLKETLSVIGKTKYEDLEDFEIVGYTSRLPDILGILTDVEIDSEGSIDESLGRTAKWMDQMMVYIKENNFSMIKYTITQELENMERYEVINELGKLGLL